MPSIVTIYLLGLFVIGVLLMLLTRSLKASEKTDDEQDIVVKRRIVRWCFIIAVLGMVFTGILTAVSLF